MNEIEQLILIAFQIHHVLFMGFKMNQKNIPAKFHATRI